MTAGGGVVSKTQYIALSEFRYQVARFQRFSERASRAAGLTQTQYLLLLHVRGCPGRDWATVGELATRLQASPHGAAALIKRCEARGLIVKKRAEADARVVRVSLTARGLRLTERVAARHREELKSLRDVFRVAHVS
jgi:DNA-binding MarR family transcriptional regulator